MIESRITNAYGRLFTRFKLRSGPMADKLWLNEVIVPVTQIDAVLRDNVYKTIYEGDPGGTGKLTLDTCPETKRRRIIHLRIQRESGSTVTFNGLFLDDPDGDEVTIDVSSGTSMMVTYAYPLPWDAGVKLVLSVNAYGAGDTLKTMAIYEEEDAY